MGKVRESNTVSCIILSVLGGFREVEEFNLRGVEVFISLGRD